MVSGGHVVGSRGSTGIGFLRDRPDFSFDDDTAINEVVTDGKTFHANVEVSASGCEIKNAAFRSPKST
jgi:hypothetical protein